MKKTVFEMDQKELGAFIAQQELLVSKLSEENLGAAEYAFEAGVLEDETATCSETEEEVFMREIFTENWFSSGLALSRVQKALIALLQSRPVESRLQ